jgi:hypothetical protein
LIYRAALSLTVKAGLKDFSRLNLPCRVVSTILKKSDRSELWIKCSTVEAFYETLEHLLSSGILVEKVGFLNGIAVDSRLLSEIDLEQLLLLEPIVERLNVEGSYKRVLINPHRRVINVIVLKPIRISVFFDHGLRVLKPIEAPPRI